MTLYILHFASGIGLTQMWSCKPRPYHCLQNCTCAAGFHRAQGVPTLGGSCISVRESGFMNMFSQLASKLETILDWQSTDRLWYTVKEQSESKIFRQACSCALLKKICACSFIELSAHINCIKAQLLKHEKSMVSCDKVCTPHNGFGVGLWYTCTEQSTHGTVFEQNYNNDVCLVTINSIFNLSL